VPTRKPPPAAVAALLVARRGGRPDAVLDGRAGDGQRGEDVEDAVDAVAAADGGPVAVDGQRLGDVEVAGGVGVSGVPPSDSW
jgi:hypothetical protein